MGVTIDGSQGLDTDNTELTLEVGGSEKARIDSSGNVGIGTSSPSTSLDIQAPSTVGGIKMRGRTGANDEMKISLTNSAGSTELASIYCDSNNYLSINQQQNLPMRFTTNGTERMQIQADGSLLLGTTDGGASGSGDMVVNGGIYIGGNQAANYLDDYEEGTWTPSVGGGTTTAYGYYTKVGRCVTVVCNISNQTLSGASGMTITGLPFTNGATRSATGYVLHYNLFSDAVVGGLVQSNTSNIEFLKTNASSGWNTSNFRNTTTIYLHFQAVYYTDY